MVHYYTNKMISTEASKLNGANTSRNTCCTGSVRVAMGSVHVVSVAPHVHVALYNRCVVPGCCTRFLRFSQIVIGLKKKPYDLLDQRNLVFDTDFAEFVQVIGELQVSVGFR